MSVPVTNGVLRTKLSDMKIGDYIKADYDKAANARVCGTFTIGGGGYPSELTTSAPGYFYFIKVDQGLLVADRVVIDGITIKDLNSHNQFKGSGIRCLTFEEAYKLIHSDLNGSVTTGYLKGSFAWTNNNLFQDCFARMDSSVWTDYDKGIRPANNLSFDTILICTPAYEYIDNSKSTNIFY